MNLNRIITTSISTCSRENTKGSLMLIQRTTTASLFDALKSAAPASQEGAVKRMEAVAFLLDSAFVVPGTNQRVGIDALIGLIPGLGDIVTTALSTYVIWEARNLGVSRVAIGRMLANLAIHAVVGAIPVIGDAFDALFRVNQRNMRIVRAQLAKSELGPARSSLAPARSSRQLEPRSTRRPGQGPVI